VEGHLKSQPLKPIIIAILDVSGSMSEPSTQSATSDGSLLTRLKLVKHSMKTVVALLNIDDKILVNFKVGWTLSLKVPARVVLRFY
jgi:hypothetical protein